MLCSVACMKLEEYHTAKRALEIGASLAQDDSRFTNLIKECDLRIAGMYMLVVNLFLSPPLQEEYKVSVCCW